MAVALLMAAACENTSTAVNPQNSSAASSSPPESPSESPPPSAGVASSAPRSTPTLVPFFDKLNKNGSFTHFDLSRVLPGATCSVTVTVYVQDANKAWKTVTLSQRDLPQVLRPKIADGAGTVSWDINNPPDVLANTPGGSWSGDCRLYDRAQPSFLVYHQSTSLAFGSPPAQSQSRPASSTSPSR